MPASTPRPYRPQGFSLIELLVGLTILGVAMAMAAPAFGNWMRNAKLRATAEGIQQGLFYARTEAVRRNAFVRFQFTSSLSSSCALSTTSSNWVVNLGTDSPAGACGSSISESSSPYLLKVSPIVSSSSTTSVSAGRSLIAFDGLGQLNTISGAAETGVLKIELSDSGGTCVAAGGQIQCLRVEVAPGGQISLCDPNRSSSTDPMTCPSNL